MTKKDMKISEYFSLWKQQPELDFVDIYVDKDTPLFIDPWAIRQSWDDFSNLCHSIISSFFSSLLDKIRLGDKSWALDMLWWLGEPSETHLGLSKNSISWAWVWNDKANLIFDALSESEAVQTWFLNDLEDTALLIEWIKEDTISDIVTNLLRYQLIKYTQEQCNIYWINLRLLPSGYYWNDTDNEWQANKEEMLVVNWKKVILVPKFFVRKTLTIDIAQYYNFDVLEFEQALHLDSWSSLCKTLKDWSKRSPSKKSLQEYHPDNKKKYVYNFTKNNPKVLSDFKKKKSDINDVITNALIDDDINTNDIIDSLIESLKKLRSGKKDAYEYEKVTGGIIELVFYPYLFKPEYQFRMIDWLKIVDISYLNSASTWFFSDLAKTNIACREIYFECKNYTWDVKNQELDQLNWRFRDKVSEVWFIVCRDIKNKIDFNKRIQYLTKQSHYILLLEDKDLIQLLEYKKVWKDSEIDNYLNKKLEELI